MQNREQFDSPWWALASSMKNPAIEPPKIHFWESSSNQEYLWENRLVKLLLLLHMLKGLFY